MTGPTHIAFATACTLASAAFYDYELDMGTLIAAAFGSLLPDLDTPRSLLGRLLYFIAAPLEKAVGHRGLTHSLLCIPLYLLLCLPLWLHHPIWAYALFGGVVSHLFIDTFTKQGIKAFWPQPHNVVFFINENWRMTVGSLAERLLLIGFCIGIVILVPVSRIGMPQLWARYVGNIAKAIDQYRKLEGRQTLWLVGQLKDNLTEQRHDGRWRAIGASGGALLILAGDVVRSVGAADGHNLRPLHVHLEQGEPLRTHAATVPLSGQALSWLKPHLAGAGEHWLFGELSLAAPLAVPPPVGRHPVLKASGQSLKLDHARWRDLASLGHLLVTAGDVIVKQRGSRVAAAAIVRARPTDTPTVVVPVALNLSRLSDLQVKAGDPVAVGQPLAVNGKVVAELAAIASDIQAQQLAFLKGVPAGFEQLFRDGVIDRYEYNSYRAARAKADTAVGELRTQRRALEAKQHIRAQVAGTVTHIRIVQQAGEVIKVELLIATPAPPGPAAPAVTAAAGAARRDTSGDVSGPARGNTRIADFDAARRLLPGIFAGHETTLYCGCSYHGKAIDWNRCGYRPRKDRKRARRLEWEHVVPAHAFGHAFPEWHDGHPQCGRQKGRKCAQLMRADFRLMEADLYNLQPAIGEVNGRRSNYAMAIIEGEKRAFGQCDVEIQNRKIEPRPDVRGDIARTYFYMDWAYPGRGIISGKNRKLFEAWAAADPVDAWERERARRIEQQQGNRNPFISGQAAADTAGRATAR
jgi:deoxyribonuclease-1